MSAFLIEGSEVGKTLDAPRDCWFLNIFHVLSVANHASIKYDSSHVVPAITLGASSPNSLR